MRSEANVRCHQPTAGLKAFENAGDHCCPMFQRHKLQGPVEHDNRGVFHCDFGEVCADQVNRGVVRICVDDCAALRQHGLGVVDAHNPAARR